MKNTAHIKRQFFNSLKRGTGEAYLIAKENPTIDFSNLIIKGALTNYAYDGQSENSRAQYIFDLISTSKKKDKIRNAVLKGLKEETYTWSLTHLFDLAKLYAQNDDKEAKQVIYNRFLNNPDKTDYWVGTGEILELDGFDGLKIIAEEFGKRIEQNSDDLQDDYLISNFQENHNELDVLNELEKEAEQNKYIRIYIENILKAKRIREKHNSKRIFDNIIEEIESRNTLYIWLGNRKLNQKEIELVANKFLTEKDKSNKSKFLSVFSDIKYPFDYKVILETAKKKPNSKDRLVEFSIDALSNLKGEDIREFALEKIKTTRRPADYIKLLKYNYRTGDSKILKEIVEKYHDVHIIENLACSIIDIYEQNDTVECLEPFLELYNKMNCGIHRNDIVRILIKNNVLPDNLRKEIKYDCDFETRQLYTKNCC